MIVTHLKKYTSQGKVVNVVADDTDALVLLTGKRQWLMF